VRGSLIRSRTKQNLGLSRNHRAKLYECIYNSTFQVERLQISFRWAKTVAVFDFLSRQFLMSQAVRCSAFFLLAFQWRSSSDFVLIGRRTNHYSLCNIEDPAWPPTAAKNGV